MSAHLSLVGPTASGKSALAAALARARPSVELVSVDSIAVYRSLDIGTAKPSPEERAELRWHLLDLVDCDEEYSVADFQRAAAEAIAAIEARGHDVVAVGGTGLYQRALVDGLHLAGRYPDLVAELETQADEHGVAALYARLVALDPDGARRVESGNRRRIVRALEVTLGSGRPFSSFGEGLTRYGTSSFRIIGIDLPRVVLDERIAARIEQQFASGFLEEVAALYDARIQLSRTAAQSVGYKELLAYLDGSCSLAEARAEIFARTKRLARRQQSWFRRDPRVIWLDANAPDVLQVLLGLLDDERSGEGPVSE